MERSPLPVDADAAPTSQPCPPHRSLPARLLGLARIALPVTLGLAAGLGVTEAVFRHRDGGAFPLVNVYERDDRRGVRLAPGSETVVGRAGERATHVRVNRDGYRGAEWPPPAPGDVLVVGDSLSFGLGVEEDEALPARLHAALPGSPAVIDASVPTYGPPEYLATMEEVLARRRAGTVVLVVNLINDLAEVDRPNTLRHVAVDGWAARPLAGEGPGRASSPLRTWAIQRSHAAFALWRWERTREVAAAPPEPEPGLDGLLQLAGHVAATAEGIGARRREEAQRAVARIDADVELRAARRALVSLGRPYRVNYTGTERKEWDDYLRAESEPEADIFDVYSGGCAPISFARERNYRRTRFPGARIRADVEGMLKDLARVEGREKSRVILAALARRDAAEARVAALPDARLPPLPPLPPPAPLPIAPFLAEAQALAAAHGARLVVVVAPLDAQASPEVQQRRQVGSTEVAALDALSAEIAEAARGPAAPSGSTARRR